MRYALLALCLFISGCSNTTFWGTPVPPKIDTFAEAPAGKLYIVTFERSDYSYNPLDAGPIDNVLVPAAAYTKYYPKFGGGLFSSRTAYIRQGGKVITMRKNGETFKGWRSGTINIREHNEQDASMLYTQHMGHWVCDVPPIAADTLAIPKLPELPVTPKP